MLRDFKRLSLLLLACLVVLAGASGQDQAAKPPAAQGQPVKPASPDLTKQPTL